jgi:hypothetical protein
MEFFSSFLNLLLSVSIKDVFLLRHLINSRNYCDVGRHEAYYPPSRDVSSNAVHRYTAHLMECPCTEEEQYFIAFGFIHKLCTCLDCSYTVCSNMGIE